MKPNTKRQTYTFPAPESKLLNLTKWGLEGDTFLDVAVISRAW